MVALHKTVVDECDGQCQENNAAHHTHSPKHPSPNCHGVHIPVPHCRHGNDDPPGGGRDAGVIWVLRSQVQAVLQQLGQSAVYCHGDEDKHHQHHHLPVAARERQPQCLQAQEVSGQLHEPEHSHHPQHPQYHPSNPEPSTWHPCPGQRHCDIVRGDGNHIDDVQWPAEKVTLVSGHQKAHYALCCKPANTHGLHYPIEERAEEKNELNRL